MQLTLEGEYRNVYLDCGKAGMSVAFTGTADTLAMTGKHADVIIGNTAEIFYTLVFSDNRVLQRAEKRRRDNVILVPKNRVPEAVGRYGQYSGCLVTSGSECRRWALRLWTASSHYTNPPTLRLSVYGRIGWRSRSSPIWTRLYSAAEKTLFVTANGRAGKTKDRCC